VSTWKRSKREYIRQYFLGEGFTGNAYTDFGSKVGEALEKGIYKGFTSSEVEFLETIPRYDEFEREIRLELDGFFIKGFIDTNILVNKPAVVPVLADYKTGDIAKKTAEYTSDDYIQLEIYAAALEQESGVLADYAEVHLIGRSGNAFKNEKLELTKKFITITRDITPKKIEDVKKLLQDTAEDISSYYTTYLKLKCTLLPSKYD
jgi:hypothetical protein